MAFNQKQVEEVSNRLMALEDSITDQAELAIINGLRELVGEAENALRGVEIDEDGNVTSSDENFRRAQEIVNGLDAALQDLANTGRNVILGRLANVTTNVGDLLGAAGFDVDRDFANRIDANIVGSFLDLDLSRFNGGGSASTQVIREGLFNRLLGTNTFDDLVDNLTLTLTGTDAGGNPMARHARTWAMSAVISFEGTVMQNSIDMDLVGGQFYSGPRDDSNREFCRVRVNKTFTTERIQQDVQANPIGNSSMRLPGGWNCRHVLIPIPEGDPLLDNAIGIGDSL